MKYWDYTQIFGHGDRYTVFDDNDLAVLSKNLDSAETVTESVIRAGYTYFGQFIDHDLTFMRQTDLSPDVGPQSVRELVNRRRPSLDLDSVYGAGMEDSTVPFDRKTGKFIIGKTTSGDQRDLPRGKGFKALIADPRNDENLLVAQMQVLFMNLHNRIIDEAPRLDPETAFSYAKLEVVQLYQHLVLHDFARALLHYDVYKTLILDGRGRLTNPDVHNPALPVEFAVAAFRLHGMVRSAYRINGTKPDGEVFRLEKLLTYQLEKEHQESNRLGDRFVVDWKNFFSDKTRQGPDDRAQRALRISPRVVFDVPGFLLRSVTNTEKENGASGEAHKHLLQLINFLRTNYHQTLESRQAIEKRGMENGSPTGPFNLLGRTLLRGQQCGLASAQNIKGKLIEWHRDVAEELQLEGYPNYFIKKYYADTPWERNTPLWLYCMLEARERFNGDFQGVLGGWIMADTLLTAAQSTHLPLDPDWTPAKSPLLKALVEGGLRTSIDQPLTMFDLIKFTYDLPKMRQSAHNKH